MSSGGRLYHTNFLDAVRWPKLMTELGLEGTHFHDLRATAIVNWIRSGVAVVDGAGHGRALESEHHKPLRTTRSVGPRRCPRPPHRL